MGYSRSEVKASPQPLVCENKSSLIVLMLRDAQNKARISYIIPFPLSILELMPFHLDDELNISSLASTAFSNSSLTTDAGL
jgi:hypothetical protein